LKTKARNFRRADTTQEQFIFLFSSPKRDAIFVFDVLNIFLSIQIEINLKESRKRAKNDDQFEVMSLV